MSFGQQYYENIEYQVEELIVKNNKKLTANINYNSIKDIKIDRNMQSLKLIGSMSPITIYYEGTEAEWNLIEKDIPASVTVLFNQAI